LFDLIEHTMIELHISPRIPSHLRLKAKLERLTLARSVVESPEITIPWLVQGKEVCKGVRNIEDYFSDCESFIDSWLINRFEKYRGAQVLT